MLQRFEKTNEMLTNVNSLSAARLEKAQNDFKKHTVTVQEMKKDLDNIFKRIKNIKSKLATQMPAAYTRAISELDQIKGQNFSLLIKLLNIPLVKYFKGNINKF